MGDDDWLVRQFDASRAHLRVVAYRMLGSASEADDAVQEIWLKLSRSDTRAVENLGGWLTTVVARVCLDMLRARRARQEGPLAVVADTSSDSDPEDDLALADATGLVVLETLAPAERVAFVLHDLFNLSFEEIGRIVNRTPAATRQLASDDLAVRTATANQQRGAPTLAPEVRGASRVADAFKGRASAALPALIDGEAGAVWAMGGRIRSAFVFTIEGRKISGIDLIMDPGHLSELDVKIE
jgi:RNA polymerase sigma factor (sigma-70 family)